MLNTTLRLGIATLAIATLPHALQAQAVVNEIAAPTVSGNTLDMDNVPAGLTTLAALNAAATPGPTSIAGLTFTPSGAAAGIYSTNTQNGNGLGADPAGSGSPYVVDLTLTAFESFNGTINLSGPSTEIGFGIGDWVGPMIIDFSLAGTVVASFTSSTYTTPDIKYYQMTGGTFDQVDVRASTAAGNWVYVDWFIQNVNGLFPSFSATPTTGNSPLTVQFTDTSFTSDPGGITGWAWDFDGDMMVDSTMQNPSFTYTGQCMSFDVSLTVTDATGSATNTQMGFIETDPLSAAFTTMGATTGPSPLTVQFQDASSGAVAWAWDLDGDGTTDSTMQNPLFTYTDCGTYTVSLTITNVCGGMDTVTQAGAVQVVDFTLTTMFGANNGGSVGGAVYFDVTVVNEIEIFALHTNFDVAVGTAVGLDVYVNPMLATSQGFETDPSWASVTPVSGTGTSAGLDQPSVIGLSSSLRLPAGTHAIALVAQGDGHRYTNGTGANQMYMDANMSISLGSATNVPFTGGAFTPRVWNGAFLYCLGCDGSISANGQGCPDNSGNPVAMNVTGCPDLGDSVTLTTVAQSPSAVPFLLIGGVSDTVWNPLGVLLPLDLGLLGAPGCNLYVSVDILVDTGGAPSVTLPVPNDPVLVGGTLHWQGAAIEVGINALNAVTANYVSLTIG